MSLGNVTLASAVGSNGTLTIGTGAAAGMVTGSINGGAGTATINFNHNTSAYVFAPLMSGTLAVNQIGAGTTILTANNTYAGSTTISAGTLQLGNGGTTGSVTNNIIDNATLVFNRSDDLTYAGIISSTVSGIGTVIKRGGGVLTLTGVNGFNGPTVIEGGTLAISTARNLGTLGNGVTFNGGALRVLQSLSIGRTLRCKAAMAQSTFQAASASLSAAAPPAPVPSPKPEMERSFSRPRTHIRAPQPSPPALYNSATTPQPEASPATSSTMQPSSSIAATTSLTPASSAAQFRAPERLSNAARTR